VDELLVEDLEEGDNCLARESARRARGKKRAEGKVDAQRFERLTSASETSRPPTRS